MTTDPKKDQEDHSERIAKADKVAELTDEQLKNLAAGDPGRVPVRPDDSLQAPRHN